MDNGVHSHPVASCALLATLLGLSDLLALMAELFQASTQLGRC